jgi:hypothetical protein
MRCEEHCRPWLCERRVLQGRRSACMSFSMLQCRRPASCHPAAAQGTARALPTNLSPPALTLLPPCLLCPPWITATDHLHPGPRMSRVSVTWASAVALPAMCRVAHDHISFWQPIILQSSQGQPASATRPQLCSPSDLSACFTASSPSLPPALSLSLCLAACPRCARCSATA